MLPASHRSPDASVPTTSNLSVYDMVVVGSGIAGLSAATHAAELGLAVLLVEKTERIGGSSAMSGGWFAFTDTDEQAEAAIPDSADLFLEDLLEAGQHRNDRALLETYLHHQQPTYRWLKDHGVVFDEVEISSGQSAPRSHHTAIKDVLAGLHSDFTAAGGHTRLEHRAAHLLRDSSGRVTGVTVESAEGLHQITTRAGVALATGGFSRSTELLRTFAPEQLAAIPYGGKGNTGDGLRMAWRLGAGMADMSYVSGTFGSHPDTGEDFHELLTAYYMGAIIVNKLGQRYVDESRDYKSLGRAVLDQPDGLGFEIFDAKVRAQSHRGVALKDIDTLEDLGHVHRADTLEELAAKAGIDPAALTETVHRYNSAVSAATPDDLGRTSLCNGVGQLPPIDTPPYFAYPAKSLLTSTYCGLTINTHGQVLDIDGEVIDGLYALGEVTGGFHGASYITGTSLGKGAVFGRVVAQHAAECTRPQSDAQRPPKIGETMKFHHVALFVSNLDKSLELWRDVLGFDVLVDRVIPDTATEGRQARMPQHVLDDIFGVKGANSRMALLQSRDGAMIELQQPTVPAVQKTPRENLRYRHTGIHEVAFLVEDIEPWFDKVRSAGYETNTDYIWTWAVNGKSFLFYDDDGNMIQFNQQRSHEQPSWQA